MAASDIILEVAFMNSPWWLRKFIKQLGSGVSEKPLEQGADINVLIKLCSESAYASPLPIGGGGAGRNATP